MPSVMTERGSSTFADDAIILASFCILQVGKRSDASREATTPVSPIYPNPCSFLKNVGGVFRITKNFIVHFEMHVVRILYLITGLTNDRTGENIAQNRKLGLKPRDKKPSASSSFGASSILCPKH